MKKTIRTILALAVSAFAMTTPCLAAVSYQYSVDDAAKTILVTVNGAEKNESISIQLLKPGKEIKTTYTREDILSDFILMAQEPADSNGERMFSASLDGVEPGDITVRINGSEKGRIFYATAQQKAVLIAKAVKLCEGELPAAKTGLAELLAIGSTSDEPSAAMKMLTLIDTSDMIYKVSDKALLYEALYKSVKGKSWNVEDLSEDEIAELVLTEEGLSKVAADIGSMIDSLTFAAKLEGINEGLIDAADEKEALGYDEKYVNAYTEKLSVNEKNTFTANYFKGKNHLTAEAAKEAYAKGVLTALCTGADSWGDVEYFITSFGEESGILMSSFNSAGMTTTKKSQLYTYVLENSYETVNGFSKAVNEKMAALLKETALRPSGSGSSGGGGGRGLSVGTGMNITQPITPVTEPEDKFSDLAGFDWAKASIAALADDGIVSGTGGGKFEPSRNVTREEMLTMLLRAYKVELGEGNAEFTDTIAGEWYAPYITAAKKSGFVKGNPDGTFGIGNAITREDAAVMAYRIAQANGRELNAEISGEFADNAAISDYAKEAVYALKNAGVLSGKGEGKFEPKANCTRAEAAKIIYTLIAE